MVVVEVGEGNPIRSTVKHEGGSLMLSAVGTPALLVKMLIDDWQILIYTSIL